MKTLAIIVAGGSGSRFGAKTPKQFLEIAGKPLLAHTIARFEDTLEIDDIFVVVPEHFVDFTYDKIIEANCFGKVSRVIVGGESRAESTRNGLLEVSSDVELVAIHDGARPLVSPVDIGRVIESAKANRAAVLVTRISDTIKRATEGTIIETVNRQELYAATTPQVFERDLLLKAHESFASKNNATDDSFVVERFGVNPQIVIAEHPNPKVTTPIDLELAQLLLASEAKQAKAVERKS